MHQAHAIALLLINIVVHFCRPPTAHKHEYDYDNDQHITIKFQHKVVQKAADILASNIQPTLHDTMLKDGFNIYFNKYIYIYIYMTARFLLGEGGRGGHSCTQPPPLEIGNSPPELSILIYIASMC